MNWFATPKLDVVDLPADGNHCGGAFPLKPRRIVIHATAGNDSRAWLTKASTPPVSAHRLISRDGTIYKLVDDQVIAYHIGFASLYPYAGKGMINANYTSLGLELENVNNGRQEYPFPQLESAVKQVVEWTGKFGYLPVVGHVDLDARKSDPARFPWERFMGLVWDRIAGLAGH